MTRVKQTATNEAVVVVVIAEHDPAIATPAPGDNRNIGSSASTGVRIYLNELLGIVEN